MGLDDDETLMKRITDSAAYKTATSVYGWCMERLWPVYSVGIIVAAVSLVGAVHEKQALADHLYGSTPSEVVLENAQLGEQSLDDEASHLVRAEIFAWSRQKFRAEALAADI